jgi:hypothetical protein
MLAIGLQPKLYQLSYISFGFVMMTLCVVWEGQTLDAFDSLALPALWPMQEGTNLIQIEVLVLEEVGFLLSRKPRCPFINLIGDDISTLMK